MGAIRHLLVLLSLQVSVWAQRVQHPLQHAQSQILTPEIDDFIQGILSSWNSPGGVSVAVVKQNDGDGGWQVETKGYGIEKVAERKKMDGNSMFCIASNSKLFATLAVGLLISNESLSPRISWESKIADILPEDMWKLEDPIATQETTIVDMMSHRTGLPSHDLMYSRTDTIESILQKSRYLKPTASFRSTWQYNNIMYVLLSYLPTSLLREKPLFARYIKEHIFEPLGLNSTTYSPSVAMRSGHLADPIAREGINMSEDIFGKGKTRAMRYPGWFLDQSEDGNYVSGAGGVIMSAKDAATWLQVLLLEGQHPETHEQIIPKEVVRMVASGITVQTAEPRFPDLSPVVYGGGQERGSYRGHNYIEHSGSILGYRSRITRLPDSKFGVAVFTNDHDYGSYLHEIIKFRIIDSFHGLEPVDWDSRMKHLLREAHEKRISREKPRPKNPNPPPLPLERLAGLYRNPGYGDIELCYVNRRSRVQSESCRKLVDEQPVVLPGAINDSVPTLLTRWDRYWDSHAKLEHFDGSFFNFTELDSRPTDDESDPYWTGTIQATGDELTAEFVVDADGIVGFGITGGIWGAGEGVHGPVGNSVQERAEVWFNKV
ncbi:beta-lactamase [Moniliophthora roreri MCA 2997]|uniref:Beta-lactamase n=1 Tax=Moniliophthora roreri (strain MCA 2997) TaxID=1381753 RepID=V2X376_MONRO|nr:beta-lactamase [Moniliophthora roreri MCA 2997]